MKRKEMGRQVARSQAVKRCRLAGMQVQQWPVCRRSTLTSVFADVFTFTPSLSSSHFPLHHPIYPLKHPTTTA